MRAEILVIDDQAGPRESLRMILKESHNVRTASSGAEGLRMAEEIEPDLVLVDVRMPEMDGVQVLEALKKRWPSVSVAMITAYAAVETAQSAMRLGAMDYVTKPFSVAEVEAVVARALEQRRTQREARLMELQLRELSASLANRASLAADPVAADRGAIMEDLTSAHESIQAQLSQLGRLNALGEIAAEVNHDLNNLLSTILLTIELLLKRMEMGQEVNLAELQLALRTIESAAQDGSSATSRIREFLKADPYAPREMVDLAQIVKASIELSSGRVAGFSQRHTVVTDLPPIPQVFGNAAALRAVFTNILINARQALGKDPGTVRVTGWADGDAVVIRIEDTGPGMTPEVLAQVKRPFFTTKGQGGTGLGLSLSEKLVRQHGGTLEITSEVGVGTQVEIRLPRQASGPTGNGRVGRVLVVDDDERVLTALEQLLEASGIKTVAVPSAEEAWGEFTTRSAGPASENISCVLTDLDMPGMTGTQLARRIKLIAPEMPVLLLTGVRDPEAAVAEDRRYLDAIIEKPFSISSLLEAIGATGQAVGG